MGDFSADNQRALPPARSLPAARRPRLGTDLGGRALPGAGDAVVGVGAGRRAREGPLVTTGPLAAGQIVSPGDLRVESGELTAMAADVITDPTQAIGQAAPDQPRRARPLTASHLRQQPAVMQGQPVKVVSGGAGFQVSNDGVALSSAANGQAAQVAPVERTGRAGIARSGGVVEITLP